MGRQFFRRISLFLVGLSVIWMPTMVSAQSDATQYSPPPVAAPLVREGDFAVKLNSGLDLGSASDEVEAENHLADAGISPQNGWIADYPVTPDVIGELEQAISDAADAGTLSLGKDEAIRRFNNVLSDSGLSVTPYSSAGGYEPPQTTSENYPNPSVVNNYYYDAGPPVITYYTPPPDFYYLYAWVPFPFWYTGFWFPGFFVLHDFHKTIIINRRPVFVSNHFRDVRAQRVFRIDPGDRFRGRTFGGIGATRMRGRISTGVPGSERRIFNNPPPRNIPRTAPLGPPRSPRERMATPPSRGGAPGPRPVPAPRTERPTLPRGGKMAAPPPRSTAPVPAPAPPARSSATPAPPSRSTAPVPAPVPRAGSGNAAPQSRGETATPSPRGVERGQPPPRGGEAVNQPFRGGEPSHPPSRGGGGPVERERR